MKIAISFRSRFSKFSTFSFPLLLLALALLFPESVKASCSSYLGLTERYSQPIAGVCYDGGTNYQTKAKIYKCDGSYELAYPCDVPGPCNTVDQCFKPTKFGCNPGCGGTYAGYIGTPPLPNWTEKNSSLGVNCGVFWQDFWPQNVCVDSATSCSGCEKFDLDSEDNEYCGDGIDNNKDGRLDEGCGKSPTCNCDKMSVGKPVHLQTGNMTLTHTDFILSNGSVPITFARTYNSSYNPFQEFISEMGYGWRHSYQSHILLPRSGSSGSLLWHRIVIGSQAIGFLKSGSNYIPQNGAGGFQLKETLDSNQAVLYWTLITPNGTKIKYLASTRKMSKMTALHGGYLEFTYKSYTNPSGWVVRNHKYLASIKPFYKDGTSAGKSLHFQYLPYDGFWRVERLGAVGATQTTCSNDSSCGTGYVCIKTIPQMTVNGETIGVDTNNGICGKQMLKVEYIGGSVGNSAYNSAALLFFQRYLGQNSDGSQRGTSTSGGGAYNGPYVKVKTGDDIISTQALIGKVYRNAGDTTKDFLEYDYPKHAQGHYLRSGRLETVKDATGKILESHAYGTSGLEKGRATTSVSGDGNISIEYVAAGTTKVTRKFGGSQPDMVQTITYNPADGQYISQTGPCNCSMGTDTQIWQYDHGYVLLKSMKERGKSSYLTINYEFTTANGFMRAKTITQGDDNNDPTNAPSDALQTTTHYHPLYPGLPIAIIRKSMNPGSGLNAEIIFDYDPSSASYKCSSPENCHPVTGFNKGATQNPVVYPEVIHRVITRGYTKKIGNSSWVKEARIKEFTYDPQNRPISVKGPRANQEIQLVYFSGSESNENNNHQLKESKVRLYNPGTASTVWHLTKYENYNSYGSPGLITYPSNSKTVLSYDPMGRVTQIQNDIRKGPNDPDLWSTRAFAWDNAGRLSTLTMPNGSIIHYTYDTYGRMTKQSFQSFLGASVVELREYIYDQAGKVVEVKQKQAKDSNGDDLKTKYEHSFSINNEKIIKVYNPLPRTGFQELSHNLNGTMDTHTDESGKITKFEYHTRRKWLTRITRYAGGGTNNPVTTELLYNNNGQLNSVTDQKGVTTQYTFDDFGQRIELISPDRSPSNTPTLYEYDKSGNLIKRHRPDGLDEVYTYDTLNRVTKIAYPTPPSGSPSFLTANDVDYYYDDDSGNTGFTTGHLLKVTVKMFKENGVDVVRTSRYVYDGSSRIIEKKVSEGGPDWVTKFIYDNQSQVTKIEYPFLGKHYNYTYNTFGQLTNLSQYSPTLPPVTLPIFGNIYNGTAGMLQSLDHNNGVASQVITQFMKSGAAAGIATTGYGGSTSLASGSQVNTAMEGHTGLVSRYMKHTKTGLLDSYTCFNATSNNGTAGCFPGNPGNSFGYDEFSRLTQAGLLPGGGPRYNFAYDNNANITQMQDNAPSGKHWVLEYASNSNRLLKRYLSGSSFVIPNYSQRNDGKRSEDDQWVYTYHMNGRLAFMAPKGNNTSSTVVFGYDQAGRRVRKMVVPPFLSTNPSTSTTYFYGLGGQLLESYKTTSDNNQYYRSWIWTGRLIVAGESSNTLDSGDFSYQFYRYHHDHLGRPVAVSDSLGYPVWRSQATPYGKDLGMTVNDTSFDRKPYKEVNLATAGLGYTSIERLNYSANENHNEVKAIIEPGTFGIQFYFETLSTELNYDWLKIYSRSLASDELLHSFTGNHGTGASGPFWGPVIPFKVKDIGVNGNLGEIVFNLTSDSGTEWSGYKILKYRIWYVPSGDQQTTNVNTTPPTTNNVYHTNENWTYTKTQAGASLIRVCLDNFDVENFYDKVEVRDATNHVIQVLSGRNLGNLCSAWVQGDTIKVHFTSDGSVEYGGFTIARVEGLHPSKIQTRFPGQYYDKDTEARNASSDLLYAGLHYNWHRYYDSEVGRYITPDPIGLKGGLNIYGYARANPINSIDFDGRHPFMLLPPLLEGMFWGFFHSVAIDAAIQYTGKTADFLGGCDVNWSPNITRMAKWGAVGALTFGLAHAARVAKAKKLAAADTKFYTEVPASSPQMLEAYGLKDRHGYVTLIDGAPHAFMRSDASYEMILHEAYHFTFAQNSIFGVVKGNLFRNTATAPFRFIEEIGAYTLSHGMAEGFMRTFLADGALTGLNSIALGLVGLGANYPGAARRCGGK